MTCVSWDDESIFGPLGSDFEGTDQVLDSQAQPPVQPEAPPAPRPSAAARGTPSTGAQSSATGLDKLLSRTDQLNILSEGVEFSKKLLREEKAKKEEIMGYLQKAAEAAACQPEDRETKKLLSASIRVAMLGAGSYIRELELEDKVAIGARGRARLLLRQSEEAKKTEAVIKEKIEEARALHRQEVSELQKKIQQGDALCKTLEEENKLIASQAQKAAEEAQRTIEEHRRESHSQLRELQDEVGRLKASLEEERSASQNAQLQLQKQIADLKELHLKELEDKTAATEAEVKEVFSVGVWSQLEFYLPQYQQGLDWPDFKAFLDRQMEEDEALAQQIREEEEAQMQTGENAAAGSHPDADVPK